MSVSDDVPEPLQGDPYGEPEDTPMMGGTPREDDHDLGGSVVDDGLGDEGESFPVRDMDDDPLVLKERVRQLEQQVRDKDAQIDKLVYGSKKKAPGDMVAEREAMLKKMQRQKVSALMNQLNIVKAEYEDFKEKNKDNRRTETIKRLNGELDIANKYINALKKKIIDPPSKAEDLTDSKKAEIASIEKDLKEMYDKIAKGNIKKSQPVSREDLLRENKTLKAKIAEKDKWINYWKSSTFKMFFKQWRSKCKSMQQQEQTALPPVAEGASASNGVPPLAGLSSRKLETNYSASDISAAHVYDVMGGGPKDNSKKLASLSKGKASRPSSRAGSVNGDPQTAVQSVKLIDQLNEKIVQLEKDLGARDRAVALTEKGLGEAHKEIQRLQEVEVENSRVEERLEELEVECDKLREEETRVAAQLQHSDTEREKLKGEVAHLSKMLAVARQENTGTISKYQEDESTLVEQLRDTMRKYEDLSEKYKEKAMRLGYEQEQCADLQSKNIALSSQIAELTAELHTVHKTSDQMSAELQEKRVDAQRLRDMVDQARAEVFRMEAQVKDAERIRMKSQDRKAEMRQTLAEKDELKEDYIRIKSELAHVGYDTQKARQELAELREEYDHYKKNSIASEDKLKAEILEKNERMRQANEEVISIRQLSEGNSKTVSLARRELRKLVRKIGDQLGDALSSGEESPRLASDSHGKDNQEVDDLIVELKDQVSELLSSHRKRQRLNRKLREAEETIQKMAVSEEEFRNGWLDMRKKAAASATLISRTNKQKEDTLKNVDAELQKLRWDNKQKARQVDELKQMVRTAEHQIKLLRFSADPRIEEMERKLVVERERSEAYKHNVLSQQEHTKSLMAALEESRLELGRKRDEILAMFEARKVEVIQSAKGSTEADRLKSLTKTHEKQVGLCKSEITRLETKLDYLSRLNNRLSVTVQDLHQKLEASSNDHMKILQAEQQSRIGGPNDGSTLIEDIEKEEKKLSNPPSPALNSHQSSLDSGAGVGMNKKLSPVDVRLKKDPFELGATILSPGPRSSNVNLDGIDEAQDEMDKYKQDYERILRQRDVTGKAKKLLEIS